jgi:GDPmannose 4,6-dehydratase
VTRALVTGITGQDGSYLAELLAGKGYDVVGMVRGEIRPPGFEVVRGDLLDPASLRAAVEEARPDEIYHLAAPTFVPDSWRDPTGTLAAIAGSTATLLAAAAEADPSPRVLVTTSSEIFGDAGESPQRESSPMRPRSPYGVGKLAAHGIVGAMRARHGLFACSTILYNHESPRRPERFVTRRVTRGAAAIKLGQADDLTLGDLDAVRDWSFAGDMMRGAWMALQHDEPGDYVFAGGVGRTVRELVRVAFAHVGLDPDQYVRVDPEFVRGVEPTPLVGDPSRAREVLGWEPEVGFEAMIGAMVDADLAELSG